jgi:arginine exporter protein ArgO
MLPGFVAGVIAGYGVAIPVGAIAVLIIDTAIRRGFRIGASAGAGAATADLVYAAIAILAGSAIAAVVEPLSVPLRLVAAGVLVAIAARGLMTLPPATDPAGTAVGSAPAAQGVGVLGTYVRFLGLTLLNPLTIIYFAALVLGLPSLESGAAALVAFAAGAFLASLSWQLLLAGFGAVLHHRMPPGARRATGIVGSVVVLLLALRILVEALGSL